MRKWAGWALIALGVPAAIVGLVVVVLLGPDSRFSTGPHAVDTSTTAVVTTPGVISWADVQVDVLAELPDEKPVFVGVGNSVDVRDYVQGTARVEVTGFRVPWKPTSRSVEGEVALPAAPTALDWWIESAAGRGGASITTSLPDETVSFAILAVGSTDLSGLRLTMAYGIAGGFYKAFALVLLGGGAILMGVSVLRSRGRVEADGGDPEGDIVHVFVDEDGVEHEVPEDQLHEFEILDEDRP